MEKDEIEILTSNVTVDFLKYELRNFKELDIDVAIQDIKKVWKHQQELNMIEQELNRYEPGEITSRTTEMHRNISRLEQNIRQMELLASIEQNKLQFHNIDSLEEACTKYNDIQATVESLDEDNFQSGYITQINELLPSILETKELALEEISALFKKSLAVIDGGLTVVIPHSVASEFFEASIGIRRIISAALEFNLNDCHFTQFCVDINNLVTRITKTENLWLIETEDYLKVIPDEVNADASSPTTRKIPTLNAIASVVNFLNKKLDDFSSLKVKLLNNIWTPTCQAIIDNYLQIRVPSDIGLVYEFQQEYTLIVEDFLQRISNETMQIENNRNANGVASHKIFEFPQCHVHLNTIELGKLIDVIITELEWSNDQLSLAQKFFNSAIESQKLIVGKVLENAEGLDCEDEKRYQRVKSTIHQLSQHFEDLNTIWKSNRLAEMLAIERIHNIFKEDAPYSMINHYTGPKYAHFLTLIQLLSWSMSNIMECWRLGALNEFKVKDLVHLIKALFSDSELRTRNIKEIEKSRG
ncbi:hypothetical protein HDV06_002140 [Boothiomyces sp. JEL0866]|nr:hypothetical protein HDV06_002140 [Boothiomyces sp. JEL0866]